MIQREPEEGLTNESEEDPEVAERENVGELKEKIESYLANWQRVQADFINYKRRSEQEKEEIRKFANSVLMLGFLPILDDLERAFASVPPNMAKLSWVDGIRLIERKLRANLEAQGLSSIEAVGASFDPNLHQAVIHGKGKEGIVTEELQRGYMLHERILRPTMVVVGEGEVEEKTEEEDN